MQAFLFQSAVDFELPQQSVMGLVRHSFSDGGSQILKAQSRCSVTGLFHEGVTRRGGEGENNPHRLDENPDQRSRVPAKPSCQPKPVDRLSFSVVGWRRLDPTVCLAKKPCHSPNLGLQFHHAGNCPFDLESLLGRPSRK